MPMTSKEMIKFLEQNGFEEIRQNGSHKFFKNKKTSRKTSVPYHCQDLPRGRYHMKKLFYPAIFQPEDDGAFTVTFPDVDGCITCGNNIEHAYEMAFDVLGLGLTVIEDEKKEPVPPASSPQDIPLEDGQFLVVVEFDMDEYKRKTGSQAVKKTLSIPSWLNEEATARGVNFSSVLQEALKGYLEP